MIGFGILEGTVTQYLEKCGFTQVQDADNKFLQTTYFKGENTNRPVAYGYAIASAVVRPVQK